MDSEIIRLKTSKDISISNIWRPHVEHTGWVGREKETGYLHHRYLNMIKQKQFCQMIKHRYIWISISKCKSSKVIHFGFKLSKNLRYCINKIMREANEKYCSAKNTDDVTSMELFKYKKKHLWRHSGV